MHTLTVVHTHAIVSLTAYYLIVIEHDVHIAIHPDSCSFLCGHEYISCTLLTRSGVGSSDGLISMYGSILEESDTLMSIGVDHEDLYSPELGSDLFLVLIYLCGSEQRRSTFRIRIFSLQSGIVSWIRVEGRLVRVSDTPDMDQQVVTADQFTATMVSIQELWLASGREIGGQQGRPPTVQDETPYDSHPPPPPHPFLQCIRHHHMYYTGILRSLHPSRPGRCCRLSSGCQILRGTLVLVVRASTSDLQHRDEGSWIGRASDDHSFPPISEWAGSALVCVSGPRDAVHGMTGPGVPTTVSFNTVVDVSRRELEALRQRTEESVSSFISRWRGKIAEIVD
ncbi:hypothetical protein CK203_054975 [Vitis vinifera]|uniref:Uncharacterized protein n=1 Tax=Vitis vinifera TaxID=29760 RepID=A0A438GNH9_VITVI|nr:hypothetical protein CK203_054975 [Vitis vinifera]